MFILDFDTIFIFIYIFCFETQIKEQKREMARKAREMAMKAKESDKYGRIPGGMGFGSSMSGMGGGGGGGMGGSGMGGSRELPVADGLASERERRAAEANAAAKAAAAQGSSKALRLGKPRDEDAFLEKLKDEGESALPFVSIALICGFDFRCTVRQVLMYSIHNNTLSSCASRLQRLRRPSCRRPARRTQWPRRGSRARSPQSSPRPRRL